MERDEFLQFLSAGRRQLIRDAILSGLALYDDPAHYSAEARRDHTVSIQAQIRNGHIVGSAKRAVVDRPDFKVRVVRGRLLFRIEDRVDVSFKKLSATLRPRNYPTKQSQNFQDQLSLQQSPLLSDGIPNAVTHVVAGYAATDAAQTQFEIYVVCPDGPNNRWELCLSGVDVVEFLSAPALSPILEQAEQKARRVKIRRRTQEEANNGGATG